MKRAGDLWPPHRPRLLSLRWRDCEGLFDLFGAAFEHLGIPIQLETLSHFAMGKQTIEQHSSLLNWSEFNVSSSTGSRGRRTGEKLIGLRFSLVCTAKFSVRAHITSGPWDGAQTGPD